MKLPVIRLVGKERWDCQSCGDCCRHNIIRLDEEDLRKLRDQHWEHDAEFGNQTFLVPDARAEGRFRLAGRADGSCVFLTSERRCRIHEKFGAEAKPLTCRLFPLQLIPHEKNALLTLRRACPTAAADEGRPLAEHLPVVQRLLVHGEVTVSPGRPAAFDERSWQHATRILAAGEKMFSDERYPPVRRVVHALLFAKLLDRPKVARLKEAELAELITVLEPSVVSEAGQYFASRRPPGSLGGLLFRLTATEYVRLHPDFRPPQGMSGRGKLLRATWRMMRGRGALPPLHPTFPATTFAALEQPLGELHPSLLKPEVLRPIERYLALSAASYQYALANRSGWSILQSIRALALTFPIALYLLRWATAGREPTVADAAKIVCALDRGQGYPALAGARHRLVLSLLEYPGDLERIVTWYAR
ncbi:MAG: YkgJ family cysteine cluster protein [Planctomycetes bacterium]|nr:YkgJ family cysteine cluster protein [Planctomycetota bacterium]